MAVQLNAESDIKDFLLLCDLQQYTYKFLSSGVKKIKHLVDVGADDLGKFGLSPIEIKRFDRFYKGIDNNNNTWLSHPEKPSGESSTGTGKEKPWMKSKFGFIPNATTARAVFMNSVLPGFYDCYFKWSKNAREFTKKFHEEGRRQFTLKSKIDQWQASLDSVTNASNPAAVGNILKKETLVKPHHNIIIENNMAKVSKIKIALEIESNTLKASNEKLYTKAGKVKPGSEYAAKFNTQYLTDIQDLCNKIQELQKEMINKQEKIKGLFGARYMKNKSQKRKQKQNRLRAKKRKAHRMSTGMKRVSSLIAPSCNIDKEIIRKNHLLHEGLCAVKRHDLKYIIQLEKNDKIAKAAYLVIKEHISIKNWGCLSSSSSSSSSSDDNNDDDDDDYDHDPDDHDDDNDHHHDSDDNDDADHHQNHHDDPDDDHDLDDNDDDHHHDPNDDDDDDDGNNGSEDNAKTL
ncbi:uncharacterized protein [Ptychodera flava]|uniref:uncharacterized protein n=1 Tax=Ptychodera flava TaxID=63121 RepID=UPI00396A94EF